MRGHLRTARSRASGDSRLAIPVLYPSCRAAGSLLRERHVRGIAVRLAFFATGGCGAGFAGAFAAFSLPSNGANFRRVGRVRMERKKFLIALLREDRIVQIVLFDLGNGQHRVLAITAGRIFAQQKLIGIDGRLVILFVEEIAHGAIQLGDLIQRSGNFGGVRRDQVHALIRADQGSVVLERAAHFRDAPPAPGDPSPRGRTESLPSRGARECCCPRSAAREKNDRTSRNAKRTRRLGRILAAWCRKVCLIRS